MITPNEFATIKEHKNIERLIEVIDEKIKAKAIESTKIWPEIILDFILDDEICKTICKKYIDVGWHKIYYITNQNIEDNNFERYTRFAFCTLETIEYFKRGTSYENWTCVE